VCAKALRQILAAALFSALQRYGADARRQHSFEE